MIIQTGRLLLRPVEARDWKFIFALNNKPGVKELILPEQASEVYVKRRAELSALHHQVNSGLYFAFIIHLLETKEEVGSCILAVTNKFRRVGMIGWDISPEYHGKGYATEASAELMRLGFGPCRLRRIRADCFVENAASRRVMEKLGMKQKRGIWLRLQLFWNYSDTRKKVRYRVSKKEWLMREQAQQ